MIAILAITRAVHFLSLMAVFGGSAYGLLLHRAGSPEAPGGARWMLFMTASTLALISAIVWFCMIAGQMSGDWRGSIDPATLKLTASATRFGQIFLVRLVGLAALWLLCLARMPEPLSLAGLAGLLLASLAPISHAAAAAGGDIAIVGAANDALHLLMASFWLGGLMILVLLLPQHWGDPAQLIVPLRIFSTWGSFMVALLVVSGLINAVSILPMSAMSVHSAYFGLLAIKVGLACAMIALAALNRWRFAPALRNNGGVSHLAASVGVEISLGIAVVVIAGFLGLIGPH